MISIKENKTPPLKKPSFLVDGKLDDKLDDYEITRLMNRSNFCLFLGPAGSGKTSMIVSLLNTPQLFKRVFHNVFLFMGKNSRDSIKGGFFDKQIPPENIYDELTVNSLNEVYRSLIIFDDTQRQFKDKDVEKLLLHIVNNRRHLKTSLWSANQNYMALPRGVRMGLTDIFVWKIKKREMENLLTEQIEADKNTFNALQKILFREPHNFMYLNTGTQRLFNNWDEIIIEE
jgi:hypothetical protein